MQLGPEIRRGVADLNGEGEVVGGVIVLRSGTNALAAIEAVKAKLQTLQAGLPDGVEIVPTYDRSSLIERAIANLSEKLIEEFVVVIVGLRAVPVAPALGARCDRDAADRHSGRVHRDAGAGHQREHHVARRHRDRHRRDGRRRRS